jgi:hypothetical protein
VMAREKPTFRDPRILSRGTYSLSGYSMVKLSRRLIVVHETSRGEERGDIDIPSIGQSGP